MTDFQEFCEAQTRRVKKAMRSFQRRANIRKKDKAEFGVLVRGVATGHMGHRAPRLDELDKMRGA